MAKKKKKSKSKIKKAGFFLLYIWFFCISLYLSIPLQILAGHYYQRIYKYYVLYQKQNEPVSHRLPKTYSF